MNKNALKKFIAVSCAAILIAAALFGCTKIDNTDTTEAAEATQTSAGATSKLSDIIDESDMFSDRDLDPSYDESEASTITLKDGGSSSDSENVTIDGDTVTITAEGIYVVKGSLSNGQIVVEATDEKAKVQLVFDGVEINCDTSAAVYVKQADKVFITLADGSKNTLSNTSDFVQTDDNNVNAVIYSRDDLTLNGSGALTVNAKYGHAISSKDDLKLCGGTYEINADEKNGLDANDSIRITSSTISVTSANDALHAENDEDENAGFIYIKDGELTINAADDAIHGTSAILIKDGTVDIQSSNEGIEARMIEVQGGDVSVVASDDGFNASSGNSATSDAQQMPQQQDTTELQTEEVSQGATPPEPPSGDMPSGEMPSGEAPSDDTTQGGMPGGGMNGGMMDSDSNCYLYITGGNITVDAGGDGLDSNGYISIEGGYTVVYGAENAGNGALDSGVSITVSGGTVIALGMSGMAEGFDESSTQGAILCNSVSGNKGDTVTLTDSSGKELISVEAVRSFDSVAVSTPDIAEGSTYTITAGSTSAQIEMTSIVYSDSQGGMPGGMGGGRQGFGG